LSVTVSISGFWDRGVEALPKRWESRTPKRAFRKTSLSLLRDESDGRGGANWTGTVLFSDRRGKEGSDEAARGRLLLGETDRVDGLSGVMSNGDG